MTRRLRGAAVRRCRTPNGRQGRRPVVGRASVERRCEARGAPDRVLSVRRRTVLEATAESPTSKLGTLPWSVLSRRRPASAVYLFGGRPHATPPWLSHPTPHDRRAHRPPPRPHDALRRGDDVPRRRRQLRRGGGTAARAGHGAG